jgi:hypothetical protein
MATMPVIGGLFGSGDDADASLNLTPLLTTQNGFCDPPRVAAYSIKMKSLHASLALPRKRKAEFKKDNLLAIKNF